MTISSILRFDAPAYYRIIVQGLFQSEVFTSFYGMDTKIDREQNTSCITGEVKDQAALAGIINTLYDHHFPILLIEFASEGK